MQSDFFSQATLLFSAYNEEVIARYVKNQGDKYKKLYRGVEIEGQLNFSDYV